MLVGRWNWVNPTSRVLRLREGKSLPGRTWRVHLSKSMGLPTRVENALRAVLRRENSIHDGGVYSRNTRGNKIQRVFQLRHFKREYALNIDKSPLSHLRHKWNTKGKFPNYILDVRRRNMSNYLSNYCVFYVNESFRFLWKNAFSLHRERTAWLFCQPNTYHLIMKMAKMHFIKR